MQITRLLRQLLQAPDQSALSACCSDHLSTLSDNLHGELARIERARQSSPHDVAIAHRYFCLKPIVEDLAELHVELYFQPDKRLSQIVPRLSNWLRALERDPNGHGN